MCRIPRKKQPPTPQITNHPLLDHKISQPSRIRDRGIMLPHSILYEPIEFFERGSLAFETAVSKFVVRGDRAGGAGDVDYEAETAVLVIQGEA